MLNLFKALIARPKPQSKQKIHWVKADQPIGEMTPEKRQAFSATLANEILISNSISTNKNEPKDKYMTDIQVKNTNNHLAWLFLTLILILIVVNWDKVPLIGNHAKAISYVEKACSSSEPSTRLKYSNLAAELDAYWEPFALDIAGQLALKPNFENVKSTLSEDNPTYIDVTSEYNRLLFEVAGYCINHLKTK